MEGRAKWQKKSSPLKAPRCCGAECCSSQTGSKRLKEVTNAGRLRALGRRLSVAGFCRSFIRTTPKINMYNRRGQERAEAKEETIAMPVGQNLVSAEGSATSLGSAQAGMSHLNHPA